MHFASNKTPIFAAFFPVHSRRGTVTARNLSEVNNKRGSGKGELFKKARKHFIQPNNKN